MKISLQHALLALLGGTALVALVPAGLLVDRRIALELEQDAREGLALAPRVLEDRNAARADALMMHAKDLAGAPSVIEAIRDRDADAAVQAAMDARIDDSEGVVVLAEGVADPWAGPRPDPDVVAATRAGEMPVYFQVTDEGAAQVALAPVMAEERWIGAAGVLTTLDESSAAVLAGLTGSAVIIDPGDTTRIAATVAPAVAMELRRAAAAAPTDEGVATITLTDGSRWWVSSARLDSAARVLFARNVAEELALVSRLRTGMAGAAAAALILAIVLGTWVARSISQPVSVLAGASERLAAGDFTAPVPDSALAEVDRVAGSFAAMRSALERRLAELEEANAALETQQERLQALQGELIQRDRLAASGRLVAELAHEIRNPVASIRNCLEVIDRRLADDAEGRVFTRLAIDELARMHELAEGLLDLNRPADTEESLSDPGTVADQVASLMGAGKQGERWPIELDFAPEGPEAAIAPEALKQILINLVQNAQEAMPAGGPIDLRGRADDGRVIVEVADRGPGVPEHIVSRIFDPFFTTKGEVRGVGLGLFVAEGIARRYGGALVAGNRPDGPGAVFTLELSRAEPGR